MANNRKIGLTNRVLDWAKEYGKHFCVHDLVGFFSEYDDKSLGSRITYLDKKGYLIKAATMERCKMGQRLHHFWIYNNTQPKKSKRVFVRKRKYHYKNNEPVKQNLYRVIVLDMTFEDIKRLLG